MLIFPPVRIVILEDKMFPTVMCSKRLVCSWSLTSNVLWPYFPSLLSFLSFKTFRIDHMYMLNASILGFCALRLRSKGIMAHAFNPSTLEVEAGESLVCIVYVSLGSVKNNQTKDPKNWRCASVEELLPSICKDFDVANTTKEIYSLLHSLVLLGKKVNVNYSVTFLTGGPNTFIMAA